MMSQDDLFMVFLVKNKKPIYLNIPTHESEEIQGFEEFLTELNKKIGFEPIQWQRDRTILAYPEHLRELELYLPWKNSIKAFIHRIAQFFGIKHEFSGIIKDELIDQFNNEK